MLSSQVLYTNKSFDILAIVCINKEKMKTVSKFKACNFVSTFAMVIDLSTFPLQSFQFQLGKLYLNVSIESIRRRFSNNIFQFNIELNGNGVPNSFNLRLNIFYFIQIQLRFFHPPSLFFHSTNRTHSILPLFRFTYHFFSFSVLACLHMAVFKSYLFEVQLTGLLFVAII